MPDSRSEIRSRNLLLLVLLLEWRLWAWHLAKGSGPVAANDGGGPLRSHGETAKAPAHGVLDRDVLGRLTGCAVPLPRLRSPRRSTAARVQSAKVGPARQDPRAGVISLGLDTSTGLARTDLSSCRPLDKCCARSASEIDVWQTKVRVLFPRTAGSWITYGLCSLVCASGVIGQAFGGLMLALLLGMPLVGLTFIVQLVNLPSRWRRSRWRSALPLVACALVLPGISALGPRLLVARFYWNRDRYEALADAIRSGSHPESLGTGEHDLAHWVKAMRACDVQEDPMPSGRNFSAPYDQQPGSDCSKIVGVHFLTVTQGFAAHAGYMRVFDAETAHYLDKGRGADGWFLSKRLTDSWYLVED